MTTDFQPLSPCKEEIIDYGQLSPNAQGISH